MRSQTMPLALGADAVPASTSAPAGSYLLDGWHAAAWSEEVGDAVFGITLCDRPVVLVRNSDGTPSALAGLCPHRFASLATGRWRDDRLQCPYHGLEFDGTGQCVANPHGPVPRVARLQRYPLVERHSVLWIWLGDADRADPTLIPDFSPLTDPNHRTIRGRLLTRANFELITDNLLDLSHVAYLHEGGLGSDAIKDGRHHVGQAGTTLFSNRWCPNGDPAPVWSALFGGYRERVDHWLNMRWDAPSSMWLDVGVTPAASARENGITVCSAHLLAPESEASTHYLWAASRDFSQSDEALDALIARSVDQAFVNEDRPMIEELQKAMAGRDFAALRPLILASDEGAVRARRLLDDLRSGRTTQQAPVAQLPA